MNNGSTISIRSFTAIPITPIAIGAGRKAFANLPTLPTLPTGQAGGQAGGQDFLPQGTAGCLLNTRPNVPCPAGQAGVRYGRADHCLLAVASSQKPEAKSQMSTALHSILIQKFKHRNAYIR